VLLRKASYQTQGCRLEGVADSGALSEGHTATGSLGRSPLAVFLAVEKDYL